MLHRRQSWNEWRLKHFVNEYWWFLSRSLFGIFHFRLPCNILEIFHPKWLDNSKNFKEYSSKYSVPRASPLHQQNASAVDHTTLVLLKHFAWNTMPIVFFEKPLRNGATTKWLPANFTSKITHERATAEPLESPEEHQWDHACNCTFHDAGAKNRCLPLMMAEINFK